MATGRHIPASHPVMLRPMKPYGPDDTRRSRHALLSDRIEEIARLVAQLSSQPLSVQQRRDLRIIAAELLRRGS
jgi:hypothetical protein